MRPLDPVFVQIFWNRLVSIVDEMGAMILRTSFSELVRESNDFSCVILDPEGRSLVQSSMSIPAFVGTIPVTVKAMIREFPLDTLQPGDVLATNDPWLGAGHLNDICVCTPIFRRERVIAFAAGVVHLADVGGRPWTTEAPEVFEEGLLLPPCKLYVGGRPNRDVYNILRANTRVPDEVIGDMESLLISNSLSERRLGQLLDEYGLGDLSSIAREIHTRTERAMRRAISAVPDGTYRHEVFLDGMDDSLAVRISMEVRGDEVWIDYAGTDAQVPYGINCVLPYTSAFTVFALRSALNPHLPNNEGVLRPVHITAPPGCILNAQRPAAVGGRQLVGHFCVAAVYGALARVVPEKVIADSYSPIWVLGFSGHHRGRPFSLGHLYSGGLGARSGKDGIACVMFPSGSCNTPVEVLEARIPLLVLQKGYWRDSGGPGRARGGLGQEVVLRVRGEAPVRLATFIDRVVHPPQGLRGGLPGAPGQVLRNGEPCRPKRTVFLEPGDTLTVRVPGGGGFLDPLERPAELVARDVRDDLVSPARALEAYGVVASADGTLDEAATVAARGSRT